MRKKRIFVMILCIILVCASVIPFIFSAEAETTDQETLQAYAESSGSDQSYISGLRIKSVTDGSAPFDADDTVGNDSSDSNGIVRSFDEINYSLEYVTALRNMDQTVNEGYVNVEFVLPYSTKTVRFNESTINWCLNKCITYYYSDGTNDTVLHNEKEVIKQVLTGQRYLVNSDAGNAIPGTGTLSIGLNVQAAANGTKIAPEFHVWMNGNDRSEEKSLTADAITVSAAPKYNLNIVADEGVDYLGYFDPDKGQAYSSKQDGTSYGRLLRYAVVVQLYNDTAAKGLKGIEFPKGDISFDISANAELNGSVLADDKDYTISLWDYIENNAGRKGYLGRNMSPSTAGGYAYYGPQNKSSARTEDSCYDGGKIKITQDTSDKTLYHCTISGYQFDYEQFHFPQRYLWSNAGNVTYGKNVGCISSANIEFLSTFPETTSTTNTLYQDIQIKNMNITSISDQKVSGSDAVSSDNRARKGITLYPVGSITKYQRYCDANGNYLSTTYYGGDNTAYLGKSIKIESFIHGRAEYSYCDFNLLQKIDNVALDVLDGTFTASASYLTKQGEIKILFAAKPDKTGWSSDYEMNMTHEEGLVFFDSIDELNAQGYTCVGVLYEIRRLESVPVTSYVTFYDLYVNMKVKTDVSTIGHVYQTVSDLRAWRKDTQEMDFSWTQYPYHGSDKVFGAGGDTTEYVDGYRAPYSTSYSGNSYTKVSYVDGVMYGHNGYHLGNSLLIIGNNAGVTISGADKTGNNIKTVYDLDAGERTAAFEIRPTLKIDSANAGVMGSDITDNVTVTAKLPKGLHYNVSSKDPASVTENEDGTTTIVWKYPNVNVKDSIPALTLSVTIGEEGTINDVSNNDRFVVGVTVQSDNDKRAATIVNGKYAETSIAVIKLAASAVTERIKEPLVELGGDITFRMRYSNLSDVSADYVKIYNILPENGDNKGSSFSGDYRITGVKIDFSNASKTFKNYASSAAFYYTSDAAGKDQGTQENVLKSGTVSSIFQSIPWTQGTGSIEWNNLDLKDVTAVILGIDHVFGNEYLDIYLTVSPLDSSGSVITKDGESQKAGDRYKNSFCQYAMNQAEIVISNTTEASVVQRNLSGTAWIDQDKNGIRNDAEQKFENLKVNLYCTTPMKNGDAAAYTLPDGTALYPSYDVYGVKNPEKKTGKDGAFRYENLQSGEYYAVFTGTEGYGVTAANAGDDDLADSDAAPVVKTPISSYEDIKSALTGAYIAKIEMPEIKNMTDAVYESKGNDAGFTVLPAPGQAVAKIADKTTGVQYDHTTGRYSGKKEAGTYKNGETATFTITALNTGDCEIKNISLTEDTSDYKDYIKDISFSVKKGDVVKTEKNNEATVTRLTSSDGKYVITLDHLAAGDSVKLTMSGTITNVKIRLESLKNTVSLSSGFDWNADGSNLIYTCKTPDTVKENENYSVDEDKFHLSGLGSVTVKKIGRRGVLQGVTYRLAGEDGSVYEKTTGEDGTLTFKDLPEQQYTLTEIKTVSGYQLIKDNITIDIPMKLTEEEVKKTHADTSKGFYSDANNCWFFYDLNYEVEDDITLDMPVTGFFGRLEGVAGIAVSAVVGIGLIVFLTKRRKSSH